MGADIATKPTAKRWSKAKKVRLLTFDALDGRTAAYQHATETRDAITADLGGADRLSTLERIMIENAAMTAAVLRDAHVRWLKGQPVPATEIATLENTFNRTAAALGTARRSKDITPDPLDYARQIDAEAEAA